MASQTACASRVVLHASISSATTSSTSARQQPALKSAGACAVLSTTCMGIGFPSSLLSRIGFVGLQYALI
eukprot:1194570-Prorocentrum_minimum.AAC.8